MAVLALAKESNVSAMVLGLLEHGIGLVRPTLSAGTLRSQLHTASMAALPACQDALEPIALIFFEATTFSKDSRTRNGESGS